jgi:hypothetical protein
MLELTAYELFGLAAMLVVAFYFGYGDDSATLRTHLSLGILNEAQVINSRITRTRTPPNREAICKQEETGILTAKNPAC